MVHTSYAKILSTLGPATSNKKMIKSLVEAGADAFRLNFSHGEHETHQQNLEYIREIADEKQMNIAILADLQGPKLRIGQFKNGRIDLKKGQKFILDMKDELGDETRVSLPHKEIFAAMKPKTHLLLNDGNVKLYIKKCNKKEAVCEVIEGTELSDRKGVNVPDVTLPISALTKKDKKDLEFALSLNVDWVALSFVQTADDVKLAQKLINGKAKLISKIEKPNAVENITEIVEASDAIMIARGDLGVECPIQQVPVLQKRLIKICRARGKPVVVATQMLESMITNACPTRAEVSDVANAVYEGVDAVMLSGETAVGEHPRLVVETMDKIISEVEMNKQHKLLMEATRPKSKTAESCAITNAARQVAQTLEAAAIVTFSTSGTTTLNASRERPCLPIMALTPCIKTARQLSLLWGVRSFVVKDFTNFEKVERNAIEFAKKNKIAKKGDKLVVTSGFPLNVAGVTNNLRIVTA